MGRLSGVIWPRPAVPEVGPEGGARPTEQPEGDDGRPAPGVVAAGIAAGVLCLWTPFTLVVAWVLGTVPGCDGSRAAICGRWGHLAGMWAASAGGLAGLAVVAIGCWVYPRRHHGVLAVGGLGLAAAGLLITVGLADGAPVV